MAMSMSSTYTGRVVSANPKGIRLDGHDEWLNYSKFATDIIPAERGQSVTVTVDSKGFIRTLQPLDGPDATNGAHDAVRAAQTRAAPSARDTAITRLAVLKAASEFAAARPMLKSGDVLMIAASWERWVNRDESAADEDLADPF